MIRRIFARFSCMLGKHTPRKRSIWHDNIDARSRCLGCGTPLRRDMHGRWHRFDSRRDGNVHRQPHPHFDR